MRPCSGAVISTDSGFKRAVAAIVATLLVIYATTLPMSASNVITASLIRVNGTIKLQFFIHLLQYLPRHCSVLDYY